MPRSPFPFVSALPTHAETCRNMCGHVFACNYFSTALKNCQLTLRCALVKCSHTACPTTCPTTCHSFCFPWLYFPQALLLCFVAGQLTGQMTCTLFVCLLLVGSPPQYAPHTHIPDIPYICSICLLCLPFSSLPVVTFQGIHALFMYFFRIPPAAFLSSATL